MPSRKVSLGQSLGARKIFGHHHQTRVAKAAVGEDVDNGNNVGVVDLPPILLSHCDCIFVREAEA